MMKKLVSLAFAFVLALLVAGQGGQLRAAAMLGSKGCYDPADYGAIPNDNLNDRVPAQQALDAASAAGGRVCFGTGVWTLTRAPAGSYNRFAALSTHGQHVEISGEGPSTVLSVSGDQGGATTYVISLDPGASDIRLRDFVIDTSGMTNTDEQTHAIEIGSGVCTTANGTCSMPVTDVSVERVRFVHPNLPGFRKGDCIRLVGNTAATAVLRTKIIGNTFTDCARSDVAIQRNVNSLTIMGNHFASPGVDQHIDGEATGGQGDQRIEIIGNTFDSPATTQGDFAVALTSYQYAVISGNIFNGRGLNLYRSTDSAVTGNVFDVTYKSGYGVIEVENVADRTVIANNVIHRRGAAGTGIRVSPHSGGMPSELHITDNSITNDTDGVGIYMESPQSVTIAGNSILFPTPTANAMGIMLRSTVRPIDGVMISNNRIVGALYAGVRLAAAPHPFVGVTLSGNQVRGSNVGLRCEGAGGFQPIVSAGNVWGAKACSAPLIAGE
ncbi:MAG: right-handed parallel beta-helix repeat-containing protein [Anaerolineae bacterium]|nr:right-handed parallel beta-helix repeat-containing protein [Anaerolineae bacterium]